MRSVIRRRHRKRDPPEATRTSRDVVRGSGRGADDGSTLHFISPTRKRITQSSVWENAFDDVS